MNYTKLNRVCFLSVAAIFLTVFLANPVRADDERELGWFFTGEFSSVIAAGNANSNTFGVVATLRKVWARSETTWATTALTFDQPTSSSRCTRF